MLLAWMNNWVTYGALLLPWVKVPCKTLFCVIFLINKTTLIFMPYLDLEYLLRLFFFVIFLQKKHNTHYCVLPWVKVPFNTFCFVFSRKMMTPWRGETFNMLIKGDDWQNKVFILGKKDCLLSSKYNRCQE